MAYKTTYISADTEDAITQLRGTFRNVIGPCPSIQAQEEVLDDDGNVITPASEAVGDPSKFYAAICVSESFPMSLVLSSFGVSEIDEELGKKLCGIS